ncbi:MAG: transcriptional repressor [Candidatus Marinimicrobia bacterium]|nr:transcriptional repressor [Candidatus Neomarinimicrobiota bacterium]
MRFSKQRDLILNIVQDTRTHPTADYVYDKARNELPNVSLGTVYRNLGQLVDSKLLKSINIDGIIHYDAFLDDHQHFQCKSCNRVLDIELNAKDFISQVESKTNHIIVKCKIHLVGICKDCQNN